MSRPLTPQDEYKSWYDSELDSFVIVTHKDDEGKFSNEEIWFRKNDVIFAREWLKSKVKERPESTKSVLKDIDEAFGKVKP